MNAQDIIRKHYEDIAELKEMYHDFAIDKVNIGAAQDAAWYLRGYIRPAVDEPVFD